MLLHSIYSVTHMHKHIQTHSVTIDLSPPRAESILPGSYKKAPRSWGPIEDPQRSLWPHAALLSQADRELTVKAWPHSLLASASQVLGADL